MRHTIFIFLVSCSLLISSCTPAPSADLEPAVPQLVFLHADASGISQLVSQPDLHSPFSILSFSIPSNCSVYKFNPNPVVSILAVEFACGDGPLLEIVNVQPGTGQAGPAFQDTARFLAWSADGRFFYTKKNSLDNPQIIRVDRLSNKAGTLSIPANVYDLMTLPNGHVVYSTTKGLGFGSETWLADADGRHARQILAEPLKIVAYLRPSPDGSQIAFILMPDSETPFPMGELWVMNADGTDVRFLAAADAGHGYAPAWSPDGTQIAFVVRENPDDSQADQSAGSLLSNVYRIEVQGGTLTPITSFTDAIIETPVWSPDGTSLLFNVVRNDTIRIWFDNAGVLQQFGDEVACCAIWVPGR